MTGAHSIQSSLAGQKSVGASYRLIRDQLGKAGIAAPDIEARAMVRAAYYLLPFAEWDTAQYAPDIALHAPELAAMLERRLVGEPLSRILGHRGFWTLDLTVTPATLDPRADTETLVEAARDMALSTRSKEAALHILDLGTGTGAILLALLSEFPNAMGVGVDISAAALMVARDNATRTNLVERVRFQQGDWTHGIAGSFDLIVSNPPYIRSGDIAGLDPEVRYHDPHLALDGGMDGLNCYRQILPQIPRFLAADGFALVECGHDQARDVEAIARAAGLVAVEFRKDLNGLERVLILNKN